MSEEDPTTQELRAVQSERARDERDQAEGAERPEEERQHDRRSDKAAYLAARLAEKERSEEDA